MLCRLLRGGFGFLFGSVLRVLDRSISRAMGCFFGCFRVRDDQRQRPRIRLVSSISKTREAVVSGNQLSSLFLAEENEGSPRKDMETGSSLNTKELKNEAKFLKACGTLLESPVEIRVSQRSGESSPYDGDSGHSRFKSWLPNTSITKLKLADQPDQPPTPIKQNEECEKGSDSSENTPSSCISSEQGTQRNISPINVTTGPWHSVNNRGRSKSVRFDCDVNAASSPGNTSANVSHNSNKSDSPFNQSVSKPSPYPTPLKLSDDMQTPGTVFPNTDYMANMRTRVRSQYVSSVMNPVESVSQLKVLKEEESNSGRLSGEMREFIEQPERATPVSEMSIKNSSDGKELNVEASLSAWLKPVSSTPNNNNQNFQFVPTRKREFGRIPGDRPIIGMVAAHWNEEETSRISPKWWDGNGIPNSTNKYKEDQKVSWHATPFEERLEKALSEESLISERKYIQGKPIAFDENEESDTAVSQMQSSIQPKSLVSF